jgi:MFS transporter, DHA2 family, multidrug resistance protein
MDGSIVNVALPTMAHDLQVKPASAVLVVTMYQLTLVMALLPLSALGIKLGLRRVYQSGQLIFLITTLLCFFARNLPFLLVLRVIQALGAGAALSVSSALIRSIYPASRLGMGLSVSGAAVAAGAAFSPILGGFVLSVAHWPWIFAAAAPFALLSYLLGRRTLPDPSPHKHPFDVLGALLSALTFGLVFAGIEMAVHADMPALSALVGVTGLGVGVMFVRRELESKLPILPVDLLMRPVVALSAIGGLLAFAASMTIILSLPFRLQQYFGWLPQEVGAVMMPWPSIMILTGPIAGMLSDRFPAGILGGIGMGVAVTAMLLLAFLPSHPNHLDVAWRTALCGIGYSLFMSPNSRLIIKAAPYDRAASASGLVGTVRLTGQAAGSTLLALLLSLGLGGGPKPALTAAGLALVAGVCSVARLRPSVRVVPHTKTPKNQHV